MASYARRIGKRLSLDESILLLTERVNNHLERLGAWNKAIEMIEVLSNPPDAPPEKIKTWRRVIELLTEQRDKTWEEYKEAREQLQWCKESKEMRENNKK